MKSHISNDVFHAVEYEQFNEMVYAARRREYYNYIGLKTEDDMWSVDSVYKHAVVEEMIDDILGT